MRNFFKRIFGGHHEHVPADCTQLYIVHDDNCQCVTCAIETKYCKKIQFANRTICVIPKDKVKVFTPRKKQIKDYTI